jgi:hypothetical protein
LELIFVINLIIQLSALWFLIFTTVIFCSFAIS